ncbi:hypothetical protein Pelo_19430 [Pelomyxa schiedti]|nr:hypothetical protein Pelo_19430 [Pelomyxa schiedti]
MNPRGPTNLAAYSHAFVACWHSPTTAAARFFWQKQRGADLPRAADDPQPAEFGEQRGVLAVEKAGRGAAPAAPADRRARKRDELRSRVDDRLDRGAAFDANGDVAESACETVDWLLWHSGPFIWKDVSPNKAS